MQFIFDHIYLVMFGFMIVTGVFGKILGSHPRVSQAMGFLIAVIFFGAFVAAFGGGGIFIAKQGFHKHEWKTVCFSIPFIVIGLAILAGLIWAGPSMIRTNRIKAAHPLEPWLWDSDWATGKIPDHGVAGVVGIWILTAIWNGISIPATIAAMQQFFHTHDLKLLIVLLFPVIGLVFIYFAIRATARTAIFGRSIFNIDTLPASPGGTLAGTVHVAKSLQPTGPIRLHLTCTQTTNTGGDNGSTTMVIWEDSQQIDRVSSAKSPVEIPVYFNLPGDVSVSTVGSSRSQISWKLEVTAPAAEVNYCSKFKIPVFQTGNPIVLPPPVTYAKSNAHAVPPAPGDLRGITLTRLANGGCEINFAAGRNMGMGITMSLCGLGLTIAAVLVTRSDAPLGAELIIWGLAAIFDLVAINSVFAYAKITARPHGLDVERGLLMWVRRRNIPVESINNIDLRVGGQMGNTAYYQINAIVGSKIVSLAGGVRGKSNAQHIVSEIKSALGMAVGAANESVEASQF